MTHAVRRRLPLGAALACLGCLGLAGLVAAQGDGPTTTLPQPRPILSLEDAVRYALENNPALAARRQQHGIAAARVIIADTYPFNPVLENRIQVAEGPQSAAITNRTPLEHVLVWELELCHQGRYRREGAAAALSRTDWEIAHEEQTLAVDVIRAYVTLLYRQAKLRLIEETIAYNRQLVEDVKKQVQAKRPASDLIFAQTEVLDVLDLQGAGARRWPPPSTTSSGPWASSRGRLRWRERSRYRLCRGTRL